MLVGRLLRMSKRRCSVLNAFATCVPRRRGLAGRRTADREFEGHVAVHITAEEQCPDGRGLESVQEIAHTSTSRGQLKRTGNVSATPRLTSSVAPRSEKRRPCQRWNQTAG